MEEANRYIESASIQLGISDLKLKIADNKVKISEVEIKIAKLRQEAHDIQIKKCVLKIQSLQTRLQQAKLSEHIVPFTEYGVINSFYALQEINGLWQKTLYRTVEYIQAMRAIVEQVYGKTVSLTKLQQLVQSQNPIQMLEETAHELRQQAKELNVHSIDITMPVAILPCVLDAQKVNMALLPQDFPKDRRENVTLVTAEVYFVGNFDSRISIPLQIKLYKINGLEILIQKAWDGYAVNTLPPAKSISEATQKHFSQGFLYLSPFCNWQFEITWPNPETPPIDTSKIKEMKLRLYYHLAE